MKIKALILVIGLFGCVSNHDFDIQVSEKFRLFRANANEVAITDASGVFIYGPNISSLNISKGKLFGVCEKAGSESVRFIFDVSDGKVMEFGKITDWEAALVKAGVDPKAKLLAPLAFRKTIKTDNKLGSEYD